MFFRPMAVPLKKITGDETTKRKPKHNTIVFLPLTSMDRYDRILPPPLPYRNHKWLPEAERFALDRSISTGSGRAGEARVADT